MAPAIPVAAAAGAAAAASAGTGAAVAGTAVAATAAAGAATAGATAAATAGSWLSSILVGSAATGSAGLFGAAGSLTVTGVLSGLSTVAGLATSLYGMKQSADAADYDAKIAKFQAKQEKTAGRVEAAAIKKAQIATLASQRARWGAAGIDATSGTPQFAQGEAAADADIQYGLARADADTRAMARRLAGRTAKRRAAAAYFDGGISAASNLLDYGVNRGL
jgi:hypothetical protein